MSHRSTGWISKRRRQQIYRRDSYRCLWCERKTPSEALTLDHFVTRKSGGNDCTQNLFVACMSCNSSRGSMTAWGFACAVSLPLIGLTPDSIVSRIVRHLSRSLV